MGLSGKTRKERNSSCGHIKGPWGVNSEGCLRLRAHRKAMGPWGSLVSLQLGVLLTPVQIWAGPPQAFSFVLAALGAAPRKNTCEKKLATPCSLAILFSGSAGEELNVPPRNRFERNRVAYSQVLWLIVLGVNERKKMEGNGFLIVYLSSAPHTGHSCTLAVQNLWNSAPQIGQVSTS